MRASALLCIWIAMTCALNSHGQMVFHDVGNKTDEETLRKMFTAYQLLKEDLFRKKFYFDRCDVLELKDKIYLFPDGHFNVYEWDGNAWINRYKGSYYGYNFKSKKFVHNESIYSYGGYGYWKWHGHIISFNSENGEWDMVQYAKGIKNEYAFLNRNGLNILGNSNLIVNFNQKKINQKTGHPLYKSFIHEPNVPTIESEHYYIIGKNPILIIEKENEKIFISDSKRLQNLLIFYANPNNIITLRADSIEIFDKTWTSIARYDIKSEILSWTPYVKSTHTNLWYFALIIPLLGISFFVWQKKKKTSQDVKKETQQSKDHPLLYKLMAYAGLTISPEKLDEILELDFNVHEESVRYRRAQLIKSINQNYNSKFDKDLIHRVRDPEDGRKFVYKIEP